MKTKLLYSIVLIANMISAQTTHVIDWSTSTSQAQASLTVNNGDTVMWVWASAAPHTVTSKPESIESFDSGLITGVGQTFSHTFTADGANPYECEVHTSMQGTITVNALNLPANRINNFNFYPNPVDDILTISAAENLDRITIYNNMGKKLLDVANETSLSKIDMRNYSSGTYFLKVSAGNIIENISIVKK